MKSKDFQPTLPDELPEEPKVGLNFNIKSETFRHIVPYQETKAKAGPNAGQTMQISFFINPDVVAMALEILQSWGHNEGIPYKRLSDVARDGFAKWVWLLWDTFHPNNTDAKAFWRAEWQMQMELARAAHRKALETSLRGFSEDIDERLQYEEYDILTTNIRKWIGWITDFQAEEPGWYKRWMDKVFNHESVLRALRVLEQQPDYHNSELVGIMQTLEREFRKD